MLRFVLVAALAGAGVAVMAPAAQATANLCTNVGGYFWSTEQDMADAETQSCRSTYLLDPTPVVTGRKFDDANHNGVQDGTEAGIPDWTITLTRASSLFGDQPAGQTYTTATGADGSYTFALNDIGPGTYTVTEAFRDRWAATGPTSRTVTIGGATAAAFVGDARPPIPATVTGMLRTRCAVRPPSSSSRRPDGSRPPRAEPHAVRR